jgi:hypothetical protein
MSVCAGGGWLDPEPLPERSALSPFGAGPRPTVPEADQGDHRLLATLAVLVALSGGPDYAAIARQPVVAPVTTPPNPTVPASSVEPVSPVPTAILTAPASGGTAFVAEVVPAIPDPRLEPALDWYDWDRLAECESGGRWDVQGSRYGGGLQILTSTWQNFGGTEFAPVPGQATREQQIVVARAIEAAAGWRQWPSCAKRVGLL